MSANGRAHNNVGVSGISDENLSFLIELCGFWQCICLGDFTLRQTSDKDHFSIPGGLYNFTGWKCTDV